MLCPDGSRTVQRARSQVLGVPDLLLYDEEVPTAGIRITRNRRLARWIDGSTWLWAGQRAQVGRGEGSSGLRFDSLQPGSLDA